MKLATLIKDQLAALASLEQQMAVKPSGDSAEQLARATFAGQATRIEQRIDRLKTQRAAALQRFDTALKSEQAALKNVRSHAAIALAGLPAAKPAPAGIAKPKATKAKVVKAKMAKTKVVKG